MNAFRRVLFVTFDHSDDVSRRTLETRGFAPTFVNGSKKAYAQLRDSEFSLVIVEMGRSFDSAPVPALNFIKKLRKTEGTRATPILVVGEWGTGAPTLALSQGADAYEPTPIQAERLVTSIERLLTDSAVAASQSD